MSLRDLGDQSISEIVHKNLAKFLSNYSSYEYNLHSPELHSNYIFSVMYKQPCTCFNLSKQMSMHSLFYYISHCLFGKGQECIQEKLGRLAGRYLTRVDHCDAHKRTEIWSPLKSSNNFHSYNNYRNFIIPVNMIIFVGTFHKNIYSKIYCWVVILPTSLSLQEQKAADNTRCPLILKFRYNFLELSDCFQFFFLFGTLNNLERFYQKSRKKQSFFVSKSRNFYFYFCKQQYNLS